ncbi:hypothetical protein D3C83_132340 [compost metagenome]
MLRTLEGEAWMDETSLRAAILKADRGLTAGATFGVLLLAIGGVLTRRSVAPGLPARR